jgi:hypothetical protein
MGDPEIRAELASGRLEVLDDHDAFDEHERDLVAAAAAGYPTVGGFTFAELDRGNDATTGRVEAGWFGAYGEAVRYTDSVYTEAWDGDPDVSAEFRRFFDEDPSQVAGAPSFAAFADRCLYDPDTGYYSTGEVRFGFDGHFWTYPQRMSPLFGWMIAESVRTIVDEWTWDGRLADVDPLTILELGGGGAPPGRLGSGPTGTTLGTSACGLRYAGPQRHALPPSEARRLIGWAGPVRPIDASPSSGTALPRVRRRASPRGLRWGVTARSWGTSADRGRAPQARRVVVVRRRQESPPQQRALPGGLPIVDEAEPATSRPTPLGPPAAHHLPPGRGPAPTGQPRGRHHHRLQRSTMDGIDTDEPRPL